MSDLTDDELEILEHAHQTGRRPVGTFERAASEVRRHRAAQAASKERVREVVRTAAMVTLCEAIGQMMGPSYWHDNPSAHGKYERMAMEIAERVADQLATPALGQHACCECDDLTEKDRPCRYCAGMPSAQATPALSAEDREETLAARNFVKRYGGFASTVAALDGLLGDYRVEDRLSDDDVSRLIGVRP